MGLKNDKWIKEQALQGMIEPFVDHLISNGVISYGLSSYGYDMRIANEFKVFTGSFSKEKTVVDPKNFEKELLQDHVGDFVIYVTIEISNATPLPVKVYANEGIAQVLFFEGDEICEISYADRKGKYNKQNGIVLPKIL